MVDVRVFTAINLTCISYVHVECAVCSRIAFILTATPKPTELRKTNLQAKLIFYICFLIRADLCAIRSMRT